MHILKTNYNGNPNLGLFIYANDKYCLLPVGFPEKLEKDIKETLGVPLYHLKVAGTDLLGVFLNGNDDILFVPKIMFDNELEILDKLKIKYQVIDSDLTALGNNMIVTEKMCIINEEFEEKAIKNIEKFIPVKKGQISTFNIVGSLAKANKKGLIVSPEIQAHEEKFLEKNLGLKITKTTINFGSPYVSSGVVCNSNGFLVGDMSGGPEIQNIDTGLGFLED